MLLCIEELNECLLVMNEMITPVDYKQIIFEYLPGVSLWFYCPRLSFTDRV
jgi:hypothetical protein